MSISPVPGNDPSKWPYPYNPLKGGLDDPRIGEATNNPLWKGNKWPGHSFTTSDLLALSPTDSAIVRLCFCTDCLSLHGTGSIAYYNNSEWRTIQYDLLITTDILTFLRGIVNEDARGQFNNDLKTYRWLENASVWSFNQGWLISTDDLVSAGIIPFPGLNYGGTLSLSISSGDRGVYNANTFRTKGTYRNTPYPVDATLVSTQVSVNQLSSAVDEYNFRVGLCDDPSYSFEPNFVGFIYDRGRMLVDSDNSENWLCVTRSSGSTSIVDSGVKPTYAGVQQHLLETYYTPAEVKFYIDEILVGSIQGEDNTIPTNALVRSACMNKTFGDNTNEVYLSTLNLLTRYQ